MLKRMRLINELSAYFAVLQYVVGSSGRRGLVDINIHCEDFVASILNALEGWCLENVNREKSNVSAIDLLDATGRVGVQVTSEKSGRKINKTVLALVDSPLKEHVDELLIFILKPKQKKYTITAECPGVKFSVENIWDFDTVIDRAKSMSLDADILAAVHRTVVESFEEWPVSRAIDVASSAMFESSSAVVEDELSALLERSFDTGDLIKAQVILLIEKNEVGEAEKLLSSLAEALSEAAAREFLDIANLYSLLKSNQADLYYSRAIDLDPNSVKHANIYAIGLMHRGKLAEAEVVFRACLQKPELKLREREAVLGNLGFLCKSNGRYEESVKYFQQAILISNQIDHVIGRIKHLNGLGSCYLNTQEYDEAGVYLYQANDLLSVAMLASEDDTEKRELRSVKSNLLTNLGILARHQDDLVKARELYKQAIDLADVMGDRQSLLRNYGNLASIYQDEGDIVNSRRYNDKAYAIAIEIEDKRAQCASLLNIGCVDVLEGDFVAANNSFEQALEIESNNYPKLRAHIFANLALLFKAKSDPKKAHESFKYAEQLYKELRLHDSLRWLYSEFCAETC